MTVSLLRGIRSTPTNARPITPADAGCWFAGASNRTADELNAAVITLAHEYGWSPKSIAELTRVADATDGWCDDPDDAELLTVGADDASEYLNDLAPDGYVFTFDEGFYLMPLHDCEGADPRDCECGADHADDAPGFTLYV